jgi:hypothetical protein
MTLTERQAHALERLLETFLSAGLSSAGSFDNGRRSDLKAAHDQLRPLYNVLLRRGMSND